MTGISSLVSTVTVGVLRSDSSLTLTQEVGLSLVQRPLLRLLCLCVESDLRSCASIPKRSTPTDGPVGRFRVGSFFLATSYRGKWTGCVEHHDSTTPFLSTEKERVLFTKSIKYENLSFSYGSYSFCCTNFIVNSSVLFLIKM